MSKDTLEILKEIIDLKSQVKFLKQPVWYQYITPVISTLAIISSLLIGILVPRWSFKANRELDREKRIDEKQKDRDNTLMRLYADVFEAQQGLLTDVSLMNQYQIEVHFFSSVMQITSNLEDRQIIREQCKDMIKKLDNSVSEVKTHTNKLIRAIGEYKYINQSTKISEVLKDMRNSPYNYNSISFFKDGLTQVEYEEIRDEQIIESKKYVTNEVVSRTHKVVLCIMANE